MDLIYTGIGVFRGWMGERKEALELTNEQDNTLENLAFGWLFLRPRKKPRISSEKKRSVMKE
jgi:hypothetical protein